MMTVEKVEKFCRYLAKEYFVNRNFSLIEQLLDNRVTIIGTGLHEISRDKEEFKKALQNEAMQWSGKFTIDSQWYQVTDLHNHLFLVIGVIDGKQDCDTILDYRFTTRCTIVLEYRDEQFRIIHFHQSVPDYNQDADEFFPKRLMEESRLVLEKQIEEKSKKLEMTNKQVIYDLKHDYLTKILNRQYFEETMNQLLSKYQYGAFVIIDIDYFKKINDNYGHLIGDKVLAYLATMLIKNFGSNYCGRIGGDEFGAFIVSENNNYEKILKKIIDFKDECLSIITIDKIDINISLSMGVSYYPDHGKTFIELLRNSDIALYQSKHRGRNRITVFNR